MHKRTPYGNGCLHLGLEGILFFFVLTRVSTSESLMMLEMQLKEDNDFIQEFNFKTSVSDNSERGGKLDLKMAFDSSL